MISVEQDVSGFYIIRLDDHIVFHGLEISVIYTYNSKLREGGLHKYGSKEFCEERAKDFRKMYADNPSVFEGDEVHVITSRKIDPYHIQRIIDTSGWIGIWHQAYVLEEEESLKRIESLSSLELH